MYRFVGEVDEERTLFVVAYEVDGVVGQYVGGVEFRIELYALAVDVEHRVVVGPLSAESLPMVESGLGHVVLIAHVPFAEEGGAVSVLLEVLREKDQIVGLRCLIVHDGMGVRKQTGEDGGPARRGERCGHERIFHAGAFAGHAVERRGLQPRNGSREPHEVVAVVVAEDEDDVARFFAVAGDRDRSGRSGCRLRNVVGCEACGQRDSFQVHHSFMIVVSGLSAIHSMCRRISAASSGAVSVTLRLSPGSRSK